MVYQYEDESEVNFKFMSKKLTLILLSLVVLSHSKIREIEPLAISDSLSLESYCGDITIIYGDSKKVISVVKETCDSSGGRMDANWNVVTGMSYVDGLIFVNTTYSGFFKVDISTYAIEHLRFASLPAVQYLEFEVKPAVLKFYRIEGRPPVSWVDLESGFNFVFKETIKEYGFKSFGVKKVGDKLIIRVDEYKVEVEI